MGEDWNDVADMEESIAEADKHELKSWWTSLWTIRLMNIIGLLSQEKEKTIPYRDYYVWADPAEDGGITRRNYSQSFR